jgi:hypothetical protein
MAPRKRNTSDIWIAKVGFNAIIDGEEERVRQGDRVREGAAVLTAHREHFEPADDHVRFAPEIEQATAAPGEVRG